MKHFLPIDHRLHGADAGKPEVRTVVHVHGAKTPPESDGWPEDWFVSGKSATYTYPNNQDPAMLWYHDHAMGINRLNIYAGLAGAFLIRDAKEDALNLPKGRFEMPLVLCDRFLLRDGSLDYPESGEPESPWVPEVFGNIMTVNGKVTPYLDVEPRKYRFRVLNASNGRFYHLSLSNGQSFQQIGTDQGLLPAPIQVPDFVLAPGERVDLVIDFKDSLGAQIVLNNDAFPMMQFRVGRVKTADPSSLPAALRPVPKMLGVRGRADSSDCDQRVHGSRGRVDADVAERLPLEHADHGAAQARLDRNLEHRQSHRRFSSHPRASGPLPDSGSP